MPGGYEGAVAAVLDELSSRLPMAMWLATWISGDMQSVLVARGDGFDIRSRTSWPYAESLCARMVGGAPRVAPVLADVPAYLEAPMARRLGIGSYLGVPIENAGQVVGTLCAIDPEPQPETIGAELGLVETFALLLGSLAAVDSALEQERVHGRQSELDALIDSLTGLANRRSWDRILVAEEARCARHGYGAFVIVVDLDGLKAINDAKGHQAGDAVLQATARAIAGASRAGDFVARLGGDEFGVVVSNCDPLGGARIVARVRRGLAGVGIVASVAGAVRTPEGGLAAAWANADAAMYETKQHRRDSAG